MIDPGALTGIDLVMTLVRIVGLGLVAAISAGTVAFVYRARFDLELPDSAAIIVGLGVVAVYLNSHVFFVQFVGADGDPLTASMAITNLLIFLASGVGSVGGHSLGDRLGSAQRFNWLARPPSLSPIVRATGRYITVTLPEDIADIEGHDPIDPEQKDALAGRQFDFTQGLTVAELETQLRERLTDRHAVGYVDLELTADGKVEYLAVGGRPAGLGPTVPPGMVAVAVAADPPFSASAGDSVELWSGSPPEPVGTAELRAAVDDVATLLCERELADRIDPDATYRIVTLPDELSPERAFATMIRRGRDGIAAVTVEPDGVLDGAAVRELSVAVVAIERSGTVIATPASTTHLAGDDRLYVLGRPERLRKLDDHRGVTVGWPDERANSQ